MKKVLFATTALIASAGIASAQGVALSGSAELGIIGGEAADGSDIEAQFWNDVDVRFTMSGETDNGIAFGTAVDLDEAGGLGAEEDNIGVAVFLSGNFGTLTLGDTDGALDRVMQDASSAGNPGSIDDSETAHAGYEGSFSDGEFDNQILRYEYSFGDFLVTASYEQGAQDGVEADGVTAGGADDGVLEEGDPDGTYGIGVRYSGSFGATDVTAGLGYLNVDDVQGDGDIIGVSVLVELDSGFSGVIGYVNYEDYDGSADEVTVGVDDDYYYIGLGYTFDAFSIHANYGEFDTGDEGFGIAAAYDLGGGASVHIAYGDSDFADGTSSESYSFGVAMSF